MSHNFTIDMRDLCERPGIKCDSLTLAGNWVNASVHTVFDGILLPHDDEKHLRPHLCEFSWGLSSLMYVTDAPVSASPDFIVIYIVWR